jgi:DNA-binding protein HU-beta
VQRNEKSASLLSYLSKGNDVNKSQLIDALATRYEGNRRQAQHALESVLDTITREVAKGNKVAITGFGSFEKQLRKARMVRNPRTGESIKAKAVNVPKFKAGQDLKNVVSGAKKLPAVAVAASVPGKKTAKAVAKKVAKKAPAPAKKTAKAAAKKVAKKAPAKKAPAKKAPAKKAPAKKAPAKKAPAKKAPAKKAPAKKAPAKKAPAKKAPAKKAPAKKAPAKKAPAKKAPAKKAPAKKAPAKKAAKK